MPHVPKTTAEEERLRADIIHPLWTLLQLGVVQINLRVFQLKVLLKKKPRWKNLNANSHEGIEMDVDSWSDQSMITIGKTEREEQRLKEGDDLEH